MIIRANEKGENYDKQWEYNVPVAGDSLDDGVWSCDVWFSVYT